MRSKIRRGFLLFIWLVLLALPSAALAEGPTQPDQLFRDASNLISAGDYETALEVLDRIPAPGGTDSAADFIKSRVQKAQLYHALAMFDEADASCHEVLALFPDNIEATNLLDSLAKAKKPKWLLFIDDMKLFLPSLIQGAGITLFLVVITMVISPIGGLLIALGRISGVPPLRWLSWFIIWFFRGTPLLLQLFFIYYGLPSLGVTLSPTTSAIIGLGINYSAYLAEIIRAGIESIDSGQMEAAKAIGMTYTQAMRRVIVPQTYKRLMPPVGNEFIALIKDTALVSTIAMVELMRSANQMFNTYFNVNVLIIAAMIYLLFTTVFTVTFETIEKRVGAYENR
ncbi:ABC transporter permease subunit [Desulfoluna sp.]|uniref:ABC transporter permease subunit n=1 Tax=Desulfoluna sp. TaxID=2045199 RepID=UPI00260D0379|nr:ABC transporter permease subunit [Desulfoluna sp.]